MLAEYKDQIGAIAGAVSVIQLLSPSLMCKDIVKRGSSTEMDATPFLGGVVMPLLFLQHATLMGDTVMLNVNLVAIGLGLIYLSVYYVYTEEKRKLHVNLGKALIVTAALIIYAQWENADVVKFRFGSIITLIIFILISAPLLDVRTMLRTGNTDSLPMPLIISGAIVSISWLLYGLAIEDAFLQIQNSIALLIQALQIGVFAYAKSQERMLEDLKKD